MGSGKRIGYVRVSTVDQNLDRQIEAIGPVDRLFEDHVTGSTVHRPGLDELRRFVREDDVIIVKSPDRLARSTRDLLSLIEEFQGKGVDVRFVDYPSLNTGDSMSEFMLTVLGAVAQLERSMIRERQAEGIALAKKKGKYKKLVALNESQVTEIRRGLEAGIPKTVLARKFSVSARTIYAVAKGEGVYAKRLEAKEANQV